MRCKQELLSNMCFAPLGDLLAEPLRNGLTKPKAVRGDGVKMIGMGEIFANSRIGSISMARVPVTEKELSNNCIKKGDILFARQSLALEGAGKCAIVIDVTEETVFESHLIRARIDSSKANPYFVYYYFNSYAGKENIKTIVEQVAAAGIRGSDLIRLNVPCPDIETQNKIAAILSALDEKIAINRAINENLEEQAQALVKEYCSSTDSEIALGSIMNIVNGFAFQSKSYQKNGKYRIVTIKNVQDGRIDTQGAAYIDEVPAKMKNECYLRVGDILLSLTGNVGRVGIVFENNLLLNQRVAKFTSSKDILPLLYFFFRLSETKVSLETIAKGTAQQNLSPIETLKLSFPYDEDKALILSQTLKPMFDSIVNNSVESSKLAQLRDSLLPKLMSGELDVSDIDL